MAKCRSYATCSCSASGEPNDLAPLDLNLYKVQIFLKHFTGNPNTTAVDSVSLALLLYRPRPTHTLRIRDRETADSIPRGSDVVAQENHSAVYPAGRIDTITKPKSQYI
jgi:hypothetical protein